MSSWTDYLNRKGGRLIWYVEIQGLGLGNPSGYYKFSTGVPRFAVGTPSSNQWKTVLKDLPDTIGDKVKPAGGIADPAAFKAVLIDKADWLLSNLFRLEADQTTELLTAITTAAIAQFQVRNANDLAVDDVIFIGHESMIITNISSLTIDVTRGAFGTIPVQHGFNAAVRKWPRRLHDRALSLYVIPEDASSENDRRKIDDYRVHRVGFSDHWASWVFTSVSTVMQTKRRIGDNLQGHFRASAIFPGDPVTMTVEKIGISEHVDTLDVWNEDRIWMLLDDQEIVLAEPSGWPGSGRDPAYERFNQVTLHERAQLGTQAVDLQAAGLDGRHTGTLLKPILVADTDSGYGSIRYHPNAGVGDPEDRADAEVKQSSHFVDIAMCFLTSSKTAGDALELVNYKANKPNWSLLPVGYGAGVPVDQIDVDSAIALKARTPDFFFPGFILKEPAELARTLNKQFFELLGVFLSIRNGKITFIMPRLPFEGEDAPTLDESSILGGKRNHSRAMVKGTFDASSEKRAILVNMIGPYGEPVQLLVTAGDFADAFGGDAGLPTNDDAIVIDAPGIRADQFGVQAFIEEIAARRLFRNLKPPMLLDVDADLDQDSNASGQLVKVTFFGAPDLKTGTRGWTDVIMTILGRKLRVKTEPPGYVLRLMGWGPSVKVGRISPAVYVSSWEDANANEATSPANRYTDADGDALSLPTQDVAAFSVGMVCKLISHDGEDSGSQTETVVSIDTGNNRIEFSGDFGVGDPTGDVVVLADYTDARTEERAIYTAWGDGDANSLAGAATPWAYGEL